MNMSTIKDFIKNNENVPIIIKLKQSKDLTDPTSKQVWKGMLYNVPIELYDKEVIEEGYGFVSKCNILKIIG